MQEINDELIRDFFSGLCTKEEAEKVLEYLKKHPEHHYLLNEWNTADGEAALPEQYSNDMYDEVLNGAGILKKEKRSLHLVWGVTAAACITGLVFIGMWFFGTKENLPSRYVEKSLVPQIEWVERQNTQDTAIALQLPDGSKITLSPHAYIRYKKEFTMYARRDVYMKGEVFFEVAKNKEKPFTVYSGFISTTALGTAFRVSDLGNGGGISVRLHEGKVVIAVTDSAFRQLHKDYYLSPGEELVFSAENKPGITSRFGKKNSKSKLNFKSKRDDQPVADQSYMFNNQTLADVLDQLSAIYHIPIEYSREDIGKIYFIGRIERDEAVEKTIRDIALLNKLSVQKLNGGYILKRKKH